jgi:hypothetical protein
MKSTYCLEFEQMADSHFLGFIFRLNLQLKSLILAFILEERKIDGYQEIPD